MRNQKLVWWGGEQVPGTHCEDAPCCGCCGSGSDDPAYNESDPYDAYDEDRERYADYDEDGDEAGE